MICVVCGMRDIPNNHKCSSRVEATWQAKQTRANNADSHEQPRTPEHMRLFYGLAMMEAAEK